VWIVLFLCFVDVFVEEGCGVSLPTLSMKVVFYTVLATFLIFSWVVVASGELGVMRWWPTRDNLARLVPATIANATTTKCR
jgi:hypothetical protein